VARHKIVRRQLPNVRLGNDTTDAVFIQEDVRDVQIK
jgi:hypothetical protein